MNKYNFLIPGAILKNSFQRTLRVSSSLQPSLKLLSTQTQAVSRQRQHHSSIYQILSLLKTVRLPHSAWFHWRRCDRCSNESGFSLQIAEAGEEKKFTDERQQQSFLSLPTVFSTQPIQFREDNAFSCLFAQVFIKSCSPSHSI